ncbi:alpha-galactosidase [Lactococcus hodotermopsidis]|uniref:Alpha-galactosidase n=1 Tax=Pseudolactococcus hodotermopsidis TaxID=2709157 RepID=A0A6A0BBI8_9LACT|nr:alpha-galactosidase [Lactococcus hodotermopsidis]GFH42206.1 alpha-galactosidase [Lactococcus hodotermopsidis]
MIHVNEETLEFHLKNDKISYIFRVMEETAIMEQLYFGASMATYDAYDFLIERESRPGNNQVDGTQIVNLDDIKQELPVYGTTDFRQPALEIIYPTGDRISHFAYSHYDIRHGKEKLKGLPTTFGKKEDVDILAIFLTDRYSDLQVEMRYAIYKDFPVITRQNIITNLGSESHQLETFLSLNLDLPNDNFEWLHLHGAWAREAQLSRDKLIIGTQQITSTRGASSHVHNPFLAICQPETTENQGCAYGFSLIYSGNFLAQIQLDTYDVARVQLGINPFQFSWELAENSSFTTPEAVMVYSEQGLNGMSQTFHEFYKTHLINQKWVHQKRPVLINNWEATYFDFDEEKILNIAKKAKNLGVDLFVLDDGWFGSRDTDNGSLGNWTPDLRKLPNGIAGLAKKIVALDMQFGLWFEPEMVSIDTPLFQEHPDWRIGNPDKNISHGRNQFVLDFSRTEVVDTIFEQIDDILSHAPITYIKWDMNRYISESYSKALAKDNQGELFHRYILGVYNLYEKILAKYPDLLIESCAGGGGRFDPAMLYYAPQTWTSDGTDAIERLRIQYGTSMVYPLSAMGSHVSEVPNHQVARVTSLATRANVAMFGTFGYELDITNLCENESAEIRKQITTFKTYQKLIHDGIFYRLKNPFVTNECAWLVVSKDKKEALLGWYQVLAQPNSAYQRIRLAGLAPDKNYLIRSENGSEIRNGKDLMHVGIFLSENLIGRPESEQNRKMFGDFNSRLFYLCEQ